MFNFFYSSQGRISRGQWWAAHLVVVPLILVGTVPILYLGPSYHGNGHIVSTIYNVIMVPSCLSLIVVSNIKRFHDRGRSGWWLLITLVPGLGALWHIIECGFLQGDPLPNAYGPVPGATSAHRNNVMPKRIRKPNTPMPKPSVNQQYYDRPRQKQSWFNR